MNASARSSEKVLPVIGLTMGDPAGIGPELCLAMLRDPAVLAQCRPVVFGDARLLGRVTGACGVPGAPFPAGSIMNIECAAMETVTPGRVSAAGGRAAHLCVEAAAREAMAGRMAAIVTAPLNKESLHLAGVPFPGHTEMLAALTSTRRYCMMLASDKIVTSLVTTHTALSQVPAGLSVARILDVIRLTHAAMTRLRPDRPRVTVCALNPHAGENGLFGAEEETLILPAILQARQEGLQIEGPLPPDTAFLPDRRARTDAYVCMYHDQGLIPFKMLAFDVGVNVTLGLPIIRTSPDHGTAFDIAWTGRANPSSMREAVLFAAKLC